MKKPQLKQKPERKKAPEKQTPEETIRETAQQRDAVTNKLWSQQLNISVRKFFKLVCKEAGITPPAQGENMAPAMYLIQKDVLKLPNQIVWNGTDGKGGPYTLKKLIAKIPSLKKYTIFKKEEFRAQRREFAKKSGLPQPPPPQDNKERPPKEFKKHGKIGDSLSVGTWGGDKFVKGGMSVVWMKRQVLNNLDSFRHMDALSYWGGANDVGVRDPETIFRHAEETITAILKVNPNIRISIIGLPPMKGWAGWKSKSYKEKVDRRVRRYNDMLATFASQMPSNLSYLDIYTPLNDPNRPGYAKIKGDGLHLNGKYYKAVKRMVDDDLRTGRHQQLDNYLS